MSMSKSRTKVNRPKPVKTAAGQRAYDKAKQVQESVIDSIENMKRMHKISNRDIAEQLGITPAAINSRLNPAKKTGIAELIECLYVIEVITGMEFMLPEFCEPEPRILQAQY